MVTYITLYITYYREQIGDVYGGKSAEMTRFNSALRQLRKGTSSKVPIDPFDGSDRADQVFDWDVHSSSSDAAEEDGTIQRDPSRSDAGHSMDDDRTSTASSEAGSSD